MILLTRSELRVRFGTDSAMTPRKRLGVGILFFWGAYRLRSLLGLA